MIVGPLVIGELWAAIPLYLVEAVCVEVAALSSYDDRSRSEPWPAC